MHETSDAGCRGGSAAQQLSSPAARRTPSSATSAIPRHFNPGFAAQTSMPAAEHPDDHVALNGGAPPLDITHFRPEKGGDPELIRESQRRRFAVDKLEHIDGDSEEEKRKKQEEMKVSQAAAVALVDTVVELDTKWRTGRSCVWGGGELPVSSMSVCDWRWPPPCLTGVATWAGVRSACWAPHST
jgi:hypothetical protein